MKKIKIIKQDGPLGCQDEIRILFSEILKATLKVEDKEVELEIPNGTITIQAEILHENGRCYRSNAYFYTGNNAKELYLLVSGVRMQLKLRGE